VILATLALAILFMGVASPLFTRRMEVSTKNVLRQMERVEDAAQPAKIVSPARRTAVLPAAQSSPALVTSSEGRVQP
jgi:hypothetical protein